MCHARRTSYIGTPVLNVHTGTTGMSIAKFWRLIQANVTRFVFVDRATHIFYGINIEICTSKVIIVKSYPDRRCDIIHMFGDWFESEVNEPHMTVQDFFDAVGKSNYPCDTHDSEQPILSTIPWHQYFFSFITSSRFSR